MEAIMGVIETIKGFLGNVNMEEIMATIQPYLTQIQDFVTGLVEKLPF